MSPTEAQLRAALREGEGDTIDASALIARADGLRERRRRRHRQVYQGLAAAAVVALIGVGVSGLATSNDDGGAGSSDLARSNPGVAGGTTSATGQHAMGTPTSMAMSSGPALGCPAEPTHYDASTTATDQQRADRRLFTTPVSSVTVCAYPMRASASVRHARVTGDRAHALAQNLESASAEYSQNPGPCAGDDTAGTIELLGAGRPVVLTFGSCRRVTATNGAAVRYPEDVPTWLRDLLVVAVPVTPDASASSSRR